MDVRAVNAAARDALSFVRNENGPFILEMQTYRYRGHSMSDPASYRTKQEVQKVRSEKDPLDTIKSILLKNKDLSEEYIKSLDSETRTLVNEAAEFAQNSPEPDPSELYTDVLS
jgi:pyruvate dehydrogenase E1 component alpha subunit